MWSPSGSMYSSLHMEVPPLFSVSDSGILLVLWFRYHIWQEVSTGIYFSLLSTPITPGCSPVAALNTTRLLSNYLCISLPLPSRILNNMRTGSGSIFCLLTVSFMKWMLNLCSVEVTIENDWTGHWSTNPELFFLFFFFKLQVRMLEFNRRTDAFCISLQTCTFRKGLWISWEGVPIIFYNPTEVLL